MNDNLQANSAHPSKIFEFMACGKPLVVSCNGAVKKLLTESNGGIVIKPGNHEEFAHAILDLINSKEKRNILGKNSRIYIEKFHSIKSFRKNLDEFYEKLFQ